MNGIITKPQRDDIEDAVAQFDRENKEIEEALLSLFRQYPANSSPADVLLKVTCLNTLYSTQIRLYSARVPSILDVVYHIVNANIDSDLRVGSPEVIGRIATIKIAEKANRYYYSFATKYCSWHKPESYPIFDSRVLQYLCYLRNQDFLSHFSQDSLWIYTEFKRVIEEFRSNNKLEDFTFKQLDKFLYLQGSKLLMGRTERQIDEDETILVPAPDQPGQMELSVENYPSPEEAETSRKKFTDSAGWVRKTEDGGREMWDGEKWVPMSK